MQGLLESCRFPRPHPFRSTDCWLNCLEMSKSSARVPEVQPRIRVRLGREIALGPGKVELLELVRDSGSITQAARRMGMSYMRAWTLVQTMNRCFKEPLVAAARGGRKGGGGAHLTRTGREVLNSYHKMQARSLTAMRPEWRKLRQHICSS
jgi:molybdate transport system regulatory protein